MLHTTPYASAKQLWCVRFSDRLKMVCADGAIATYTTLDQAARAGLANGGTPERFYPADSALVRYRVMA